MIKGIFVDAGGVLFLNNNGKGYVNQPLLDFIKSNKGKYVIGVISDTNLDLEDVLSKFSIDKLFTVVLTSGKTGLKKEETGIYKQAMNLVNLKPEEIIYIDNSRAFLDAASSLGIKTVLYDGNKDKNFDLYKQRIEQIIYKSV